MTGKRALAIVPDGYRVERREREGHVLSLPAEIGFEVYEGDGDERPLTTIYASEDRRRGEWVVRPGSSTSWVEPDEARVRAAALLMAAIEVDRRNAARADA